MIKRIKQILHQVDQFSKFKMKQQNSNLESPQKCNLQPCKRRNKNQVKL